MDRLKRIINKDNKITNLSIIKCQNVEHVFDVYDFDVYV